MFLPRIAEGISQPPWRFRAAALAVLISLAGINFLPEALDLLWPGGRHSADFLWPSLIAHLPMLGCLWYLTRRAGTTIPAAFGLRGARFGKVLAFGILLFVLESLLMAMAGAALAWLGLGATAADMTREEARGAASSFFAFTDTTVWTPLCEELAFRALFYTSLRTRFGAVSSAVVTAAAFAFIHPLDSIADGALLFFPALLSSVWYERTRCLWPNIISHALHNIVVTIAWA